MIEERGRKIGSALRPLPTVGVEVIGGLGVVWSIFGWYSNRSSRIRFRRWELDGGVERRSGGREGEIPSGVSLFLESGRGNKLSSEVKNYIQTLLKINMEGPYGAEWPTEEKVKRREMSSPDALYIFVYNKESIIGFVQYRFIIEEETPVLYVYELQLEPAYQGKGLGKFLMQLVELIACNNGMGAVVLTVQKQNTSAIKFYLNGLRYNISSISPSKVYQLV
ncbi:hypothetical protein E3N88_11788 [Mikania micrantha]|uniref:N-alpha-acetyltransferase 40 n=1 Tax=Mikania micrantha TaxID=192012 RepID=A0A5N6P3T2_9ASTR|nr:hypothetical protein E3N88_11788 [Mikania micrantha]